MPHQFAPYHLRLDWMMWFLPLAAQVDGESVFVRRYERWFTSLIGKLLVGDRQLLALLKYNPFPDRPPTLIRARFYRYQYAEPSSGAYWSRQLVGEYMRPVSLHDLASRA